MNERDTAIHRSSIRSLPTAALPTAEQLLSVIENLPNGVAAFDREDRLVLCNASCRELLAVSAPVLVEGTRYTDLLRYGLAYGQYAVPTGQEAAWLDQQLASHREPQTAIDQRLGCGRWVQTTVRATPDGGRLRLWADITERKLLESNLSAERDFLAQVISTSTAAVVVVDNDGSLALANQAAEAVLGVAAAIATTRPFDHPAWRITGVDGDPLPVEELPFVKVQTTGAAVFDVRHAIEWPDGTRRILSINAAPLARSADSLPKVVCSVTDITDKLQAESDLRYKEALLRGLFELCPLGISLTDHETGAFIDANRALLENLGYSHPELLTLTHFDITPVEYHRCDAAYQAITGHYGPWEKENIRKDGSRFTVLVRGIVIDDLAGKARNWSIVEDITERKAQEAHILRLAQSDQLTGLANRRLFQERLAEALARARRGRHIGAVAMLDLDGFKLVNDSHGHKVGDAVLVEAASRLKRCIRATDTLARFGGDEFLLIFDDIAGPGDVARIAEKIQVELARPYVVEGGSLALGASIGICLYPAQADEVDELIRQADMAMFCAKRQGGNRACFSGTADGA